MRGPDLFFRGDTNFWQDGGERARPLNIYFVKVVIILANKSILRADTQKKHNWPPTNLIPENPLQWQQMKLPTAQHVTSALRRTPTRRGSRQSGTALVAGIQQALHTCLASPHTPNKNAWMAVTEMPFVSHGICAATASSPTKTNWQ